MVDSLIITYMINHYLYIISVLPTIANLSQSSISTIVGDDYL